MTSTMPAQWPINVTAVEVVPALTGTFSMIGSRANRSPYHLVPESRELRIPTLAGTKAAIVRQRAEAKDYLDIDALLNDCRIDLPAALVCAREIYGRYSTLSSR
jgi:hypothetical protein